MSKSLTFVWCLIGTKPYHHVDVESHHEILEELAALIDSGTIKCHLTKRLGITVDELKEAHRTIQSGKNMGKLGLGVDDTSYQKPFT